MVPIIAEGKFNDTNKDIREDLMESARQLLDHILDITPNERFIAIIGDKANDIEKALNNELLDRAMNHFKGRQGMSGILIEGLIQDMIKAEKVLNSSKSEATMTRWMAYNAESQYKLLFRQCHHAVPVVAGVKEGRTIYCHICIKNNKNAAFQKVMDEVISGSEQLPRSDQFNTNVGFCYPQRTGKLELTDIIKSSGNENRELKNRATIFDTAISESKRQILDNVLFDL